MNSIRDLSPFTGVTIEMQTNQGCTIHIPGKFKDENSRLIPWSLELQLYNFKVGHKPGGLNLKAYQDGPGLKDETHNTDTKLGVGGKGYQGGLPSNIPVKAP